MQDLAAVASVSDAEVSEATTVAAGTCPVGETTVSAASAAEDAVVTATVSSSPSTILASPLLAYLDAAVSVMTHVLMLVWATTTMFSHTTMMPAPLVLAVVQMAVILHMAGATMIITEAAMFAIAFHITALAVTRDEMAFFITIDAIDLAMHRDEVTGDDAKCGQIKLRPVFFGLVTFDRGDNALARSRCIIYDGSSLHCPFGTIVFSSLGSVGFENFWKDGNTQGNGQLSPVVAA